jgi:hypothetical protein
MSEPYWVALGPKATPVDYVGDWAAGTPYLPGQVVRRNGADHIAVNPSTGQEPPGQVGALPVIGLGLAFPASPYDGQEYVLVDSLTAPTFTWRFRYMAASSGNKWKFVGGAPRATNVQGSIVKNTLPPVDLTSGPTFVVPVSGAYLGCWGAAATVQVTAITTMQVFLVGTVSGGLTGAYAVASDQYTGGFISAAESRNFVAGETLKIQVALGHTNSVQFNSGWFNITPIAVGG